MQKNASEVNMKKNTHVSTKAQEEVKTVKHYGLKRMAHTLRLQIETVQRTTVDMQQECKKA